jgi:nucleoside-diphosphate-sugar epimerase
MRIFLCGSELGLGFVVGQRLLAEGHKVTMLTSYEDLMPNLSKNKMNPVLGSTHDPPAQLSITKADAVIDVECPNPLLLRRVHVDRLRPYRLARALQGSDRPLIVTSSAAVLGDTGPTPVTESAPLRPLPGYAWLSRFEKEILKTSTVRTVVIRPAWELHGCRPPNWQIAIDSMTMSAPAPE